MAISSMTGFASAENEALVWEIRAVNHRFLELNFRLPEVCRHLEPALRAAAKTQLARGKVDCTLRQTNDTEARLEINSGVVEQVKAAVGSIDHLTQEKTQLSGLDLLKWPGVLTHAAAGPDDLAILDGFNTALNLFKANREREGAATAESILNRLDLITDLMTGVKTEIASIIQSAEARLIARFDALKLDLDPERLHQEIVLLTSKADVAEEIDRIDAHVREVRRCLAAEGPVGRRLDFLMQELNREANTLASKSIATESTFSAVELKVAIEQMREQIQNLE